MFRKPRVYGYRKFLYQWRSVCVSIQRFQSNAAQIDDKNTRYFVTDPRK